MLGVGGVEHLADRPQLNNKYFEELLDLLGSSIGDIVIMIFDSNFNVSECVNVYILNHSKFIY